MAWLYLNPELEPAAAVVGGRVSLRGDEARHAVTVARARVGQVLSIGNGDGLIVTGEVVSTDADALTLEVTVVRSDPAPSPELWLAQALAKGDRDELAIQAATELGVSGVTPWSAERSVTKWEGPKAERNRARWASIVREASKQSIRSRVPEVTPASSTAQLLATSGRTLVLDPGGDVTLGDLELPTVGRLTLVVGPEGGVSPHELQVFRDAGASIVRLGPEVLRTSTAGPAALAVLNLRLGRW